MAEDEHGFEGASGTAAKARHQVSFARVRSEDDDVGWGEAGVEEALAHGFSDCSGAPDGVGGVDLDELLEDIVGELARRRVHRGRLGLKVRCE